MSKEIMFFPNGNTAAFIEGGQVPSLQVPWVKLYVEYMKSQGAPVDQFTFRMPDGKRMRWLPDYDNWEIYGE